MYLSDQPWRELNGTWLKIERLKRFVLISASTKSSWRTHEVSMLNISFYFIFKLWIMSNSIECKTIGNRSQIFVYSDTTLINNHQKNKWKWEQASLTWQKNSIPSSVSSISHFSTSVNFKVITTAKGSEQATVYCNKIVIHSSPCKPSLSFGSSAMDKSKRCLA